MFRWFFAFFIISVIGLAALIWYDTRTSEEPAADISMHEQPLAPEQSSQNQEMQSTVPETGEFNTGLPSQEFETHHQPEEEIEETYFDFHASVDFDDPDAIIARVEVLEEALLDMGEEEARRSRAAVPYYGELILLYNRLGRTDAAAEASRHIAMIVDDPQDWWNAAAYFRQWAQQSQEAETYRHYMNRAAEAYQEALALSEDAELKTDYAITLLALDNEDEALSLLEELIAEDISLYRPFLYAGMILYERGKKNESIAYIERSVEKAVTPAARDEIASIIQQTTIEI